MNTTSTKVRPRFIYALAVALGSAVAFMLSGCDEPEPPPPPVGASPTSVTNDTLPTPTPIEPEPCPWNGTCGELEQIDACDGWAVACGDGWRCIDTEAEAGIVCEDPSSSSSSGETPEEESSTT